MLQVAARPVGSGNSTKFSEALDGQSCESFEEHEDDSLAVHAVARVEARAIEDASELLIGTHNHTSVELSARRMMMTMMCR